MKPIVCLAAAVLIARASAGAGFVCTWGGTGNTMPGRVALDDARNVYVVGGFGGTTDFDPGSSADSHAAGGFRDAFFSKFSADGTWQWTKVWGGPSDDRANCVIVHGSNVYVAGCFQDTVEFNPSGGDPYTAPRGTNGFPNNDAYLSKYDTSGNYHWTRTWGGNGGDEAYGLAVDGTGSVYVCGDFSTTNMNLAATGLAGSITNQGRWDAFILKFNENGTCQWARCWGGAYYDDCTCIAVDDQGNVYGGGMFASPAADFDPGPGTAWQHANNPGTDWGLVDVFLTKFDADGNFKWARSWGESNHWDAGQGVVVDGASNVYVSGYFADTVDFNPLGLASNLTSVGGDDAFLCKYDADGTFQWARSWGGTSNDYARSLAMGGGYVYVSGDFTSTNADFDPGSGLDLRATSGNKDIVLSKFDGNGKLVLVRTCGGSFDDSPYGGLAVDDAGNVWEAGVFVGPVNFGPLIGGSTNPPYHGATDSFLALIPTAWKLTVVKSGQGASTLGTAPSATRLVSLGVATQVVYTAADWHRMLTLASNGSNIAAVAGQRAYTQALINVAADISNEVVFALATTNQSGFVDVPTEWLAQWPESGVISDAVFSVHDKYLLGLDPTTSNTFTLRIESWGVAATNAVLVLRRAYTGGLSPDGAHGQLELQAAASPDAAFSSVAGTAATGAGMFDGADRKTYTNAPHETPRLFIRAVIH